MLSKVLVCGIYWNWAHKQLRLGGVLIPIKVDGLEFYPTLIPHIWSGPCTSHPSKGLISSCLDKPLHPFVLKGLYQGQWLRYFTNFKGPPRCTILQTPKCERGVWIFASNLTITIFFFLAKAPKTGPPSKDRTHTRRAPVVVAGWPPAFPPMWSQEAKTRVREDLLILTTGPRRLVSFGDCVADPDSQEILQSFDIFGAQGVQEMQEILWQNLDGSLLLCLVVCWFVFRRRTGLLEEVQ